MERDHNGSITGTLTVLRSPRMEGTRLPSMRLLFPGLLWVFSCTPALGDQPASRTLNHDIDRVVVLERALSALAQPSVDYRRVMRRAAETFPSGSVVRTRIDTFLRRVPQSRKGFMCSSEFVVDRARSELIRIKDAVLDANPEPRHPAFCVTDPVAIDAALPPDRIEVYGFDFDTEDIQVSVMNAHGFHDVTFAVRPTSHFHFTIDLRQRNIQFAPETERVALIVGHLIAYSIPVIQTMTPLCSSNIEQFGDGKVLTYTPPPVAGASNSASRAGRVVANLSMEIESNAVSATVCMTAIDEQGGVTLASGCGREYVYTTDSDRRIEGIIGNTSDRFEGADRSAVARGGDDHRLGTWTIQATGRDSNTAPERLVAIALHGLRLVSTETGHCVSPIEFLEAEREGRLANTTIGRLEAAIKAVDPVIRRLRPQNVGR